MPVHVLSFIEYRIVFFMKRMVAEILVIRGCRGVHVTKARAVVREQSKGTTKGLRVYKLRRYHGTCVLTLSYA